jgi:hypothetical protein
MPSLIRDWKPNTAKVAACCDRLPVALREGKRHDSPA